MGALKLSIIAFAAAAALAAPVLTTATAGADARPAPHYPKAALEAGVEGSVTVEVTIDANGSVSNASVVKAEPAGWFEEEALRYVKTWTFPPSAANGRRIVVVDFKKS
jgi:periplasmic protein TonB